MPLIDRTLSKDVIKLAYPVVIASIADMGLIIADTAMVGAVGKEALAATGLGGPLVFAVLSLLGGLTNIGTQIITSRRSGEGEKERCGQVLDNSLAISISLGLLFTVIGFFTAQYIYPILIKDPVVVSYGIDYLRYRALGVSFAVIISSFRGFFNGLGKTKVHMTVAIIMNVTNILLNYVLIFGKFGFPRLEVKGAAIASAIATLVGAIVYAFIGQMERFHKEYKYLRPSNLDKGVVKGIVKLSYPPALQHFLVMSGFLAFLFILGRIGTVPVAGSNIITALTFISFNLGISIGIATATLVGQNLGAKRAELSERYGWEATKLGVISMGTIGIFFILYPLQLIHGFTKDVEVVRVTVPVLKMVGGFQIFDACRVILSHALQGAGNVLWVMLAETSINWFLLVPLAYIFGNYMELGLMGAYISLVIYMIILSLVMGWKFKQGKWKKTKV